MWHCEQSPVAGCALSTRLVADAALPGRVWKPMYWVVSVADSVPGFSG